MLAAPGAFSNLDQSILGGRTMQLNRISDRVESAACQSKEYVEDHAMPAALIAFGLGVGAGFAVLSMFADSPPRHLTVTQRLGQQMLDAMTSIVPDSFVRR
jgi:hypothetical protein